MKKIFLALLLFTAVGLSAIAQSTYKEEVDAYQAIFGKEKKELIRDLIKMTPEETEKFWPIYDAYEVERKELGRARMKLLEHLSDAYSNMTPEKADAVTIETIKLGEQNDKLLRSYYGKVKKVTGANIGFEFYQTELYLLTELRASLMETIPLYSVYKDK